MKKIILASASPRRRELLKTIGLDFEIKVSDVEEKCDEIHPAKVVEALSFIKGKAVWDSLQDKNLSVVLSADTVVSLEGKILGKPSDEKRAFEMLKSLSGKSHEVYTGVTLICKEGKEVITRTFHEATKVFFYEMSDEEILDYIATKEPMDKAGAYGIQGLGSRFVQRIEGDYNTVVGLPAARVYRELKYMGALK
ncbi:MAG: Maf family protein [Lachnospiraceae bacterium]|nr:Maf family protein [Lachnospiraceae bacterium]